MNDSQINDWRQSLPEDWTVRVRGEQGEQEIPLRDHPALAKYASKDEAVKALVHAQRMLGRRPEGYMPLPSEDDGQGWEEVWNALGRPESPAAYRLPDFDLPDGVEIREDLMEEFLARSHQLGLNEQQAAGLFEWFIPRVLDTMHEEGAEEERRSRQEMETLRSTHRGDMPKVLEQARQTALAVGGEELLDALEATRAGNRAAVISAFARMAPLVLEGRFKGRKGMNEGEASAQKLREMMRDPRYADPTRRDPEFVKRIEDGFRSLYPAEVGAR